MSCTFLYPLIPWLHSVGLWFWVGLATWQSAISIQDYFVADSALPNFIHLLTCGLIPLIGLAAVTGFARLSHPWWPLSDQRTAYLHIGGGGLALYLLGWVLVANSQAGLAWPMEYLPLLNPLDMLIVIALVVLYDWERDGNPYKTLLPLGTMIEATAFLWLNAMWLRTVHHRLGIAFDFPTWLSSSVVQAGLSLLWGMIGVGFVLWAVRRQQRARWLVGAGLLAVVVLKLFVMDLAATEAFARIIAFLGIGLLLLGVGYIAPVPPPAAPTEQPDKVVL